MIKVDYSKCTGCSACYSICPAKAISMRENNEGFLFPKINESKCLNCNICETVCHLNAKINKKYTQILYGWSKNDEIRKNSSSGGAFWTIANEIINENGIVYAASYCDDNKVKHIRVDKNDDLIKVLKSKYIESDINNVFVKIKKDIKDGKKVLFCGTPCQVNGLYSFFGEKPNNLLLIDFICHGVPSPKIWKYHIKNITKNENMCDVDFRDKSNGVSNYLLKVSQDNHNYYINHEKDLFFSLFIKDIILRDSCYNCVAKGDNRFSDLTLADFWTSKEYGVSKEEHEKGVSLIILRNEQVLKYFNNSDFYLSNIFDEKFNINDSYYCSAEKSKYRKIYFKTVNEKNYLLQSRVIMIRRKINKLINKIRKK